MHEREAEHRPDGRLLSTVGGASVVASLPVPATRPLPPTIAASLQAVLASSVNAQVRFPDAANAAPGVTAAIISDKGAWSGAAGVDRTGAKLNPHAMFAIASISKT